MNRLHAIELALQERAAWEVLHFESVGSTMDEARAREATLSEGQWLLVVADRQTAGRGRQGRSWSSESGGMYCTIAFLTPQSVAACSGLSLMVGVAACALLEQLGAVLKLKWPNDLLDGRGQKVGGVLIEVVQRNNGTFVLIGIGINIGNALSNEIWGMTYSPGHLRVTKPYDTEPCLLAPLLAQAIRERWQQFEQQGLGAFVAEWCHRCGHIESVIEVQTDDGTKRGVCKGIDVDGALLIEVEDKVQRVVSGHVTYLS